MIPPLALVIRKNVHFGENVYWDTYISDLNIKFIRKEHCAIVGSLMIHTGDYVQVVSTFICV